MFIAERQGFEPRVPRSTTVFKTAAIDHSATSPKPLFREVLSFKSDAKVRIFFISANNSRLFCLFFFISYLCNRKKHC